MGTDDAALYYRARFIGVSGELNFGICWSGAPGDIGGACTCSGDSCCQCALFGEGEGRWGRGEGGCCCGFVFGEVDAFGDGAFDLGCD